jgi:hypothetical protein
MTCLEELGDLNDVIGNEGGKAIPKDNVKKFTKQAKATGKGNGDGKQAEVHQEVKESAEVKANSETQTSSEKITQSTETGTAKTDAKIPETKVARKTKGNGDGKPKSDKVAGISEAQRNAIYNLSRRRGISIEEMNDLVSKTFNMPLESLSLTDASSFIRQLQQSA